MDRDKIKEKIWKYMDKLVEKEKDKYMSGMKNDYYSTKEIVDDIKDSFNEMKSLRNENYGLKTEVKRLNDKLFGRSH